MMKPRGRSQGGPANDHAWKILGHMLRGAGDALHKSSLGKLVVLGRRAGTARRSRADLFSVFKASGMADTATGEVTPSPDLPASHSR